MRHTSASRATSTSVGATVRTKSGHAALRSDLSAFGLAQVPSTVSVDNLCRSLLKMALKGL